MKTRQSIEKKSAERVTRGSGNIFIDIGLVSEAAELQVKAELTRQIVNRVQSLGLTQTEAGKRLGISQPDVSKLMSAKFTHCSTDRLLAFLSALELDVDIVVRPRKHGRSHRPGVVRVRETTGTGH